MFNIRIHLIVVSLNELVKMVMKMNWEFLGVRKFWEIPRMCMHRLVVLWLPPGAASGSVALGELGRSESWKLGVE